MAVSAQRVPANSLGLILAAGALGGVLALMFKFRDALTRITELRATWSIWVAQPCIGATTALIVFLIFRAGLIKIASIESSSTDPSILGTLAFAAGFSEPFFLKVIQRTEGVIAK